MKAVLETLDGLSDAARTEYESRDGKFYLKVEGELPGYVPNSKLAEFRDNNIKLLKALGAENFDRALEKAGLIGTIQGDKLAKLKDIDPDHYEQLKNEFDKLNKKGVKGADDIETRVANLVEAKVKPLKEAFDAEKTSRIEAQQRADRATLRNDIATAFNKAGGKANATDFILAEAEKVFKVDGDKIVPREDTYSSTDPTKPLNVVEWLEKVALKNFDFAFETSKGGGARGSGNGNGRSDMRELVNPTPQELGRHAKEIGKTVRVVYR